MKKKLLVMLAAIILITPLWSQSADKLAEMNRKVVGKWWSGDYKKFVEFAANGSCTEGQQRFDGTWYVQQGSLSVYPDQSFSCLEGELILVGPNTLTWGGGRDGEKEKFYRGLKGPKPVPALTLALAQRTLNHDGWGNFQTTLTSCMACGQNDNDKVENDNAPMISTCSDALAQFLVGRGYLRSSGGQLFFTAKAKQSKHYGTNLPPVFRFAYSRNPRILVNQIADSTHVPIEYDFVPTDLTMDFFHGPHKVNAVVSFSYTNEEWGVRLLP